MLDTAIDVAKTCVGTPMYLAPEMCQDIPYSSKADVWVSISTNSPLISPCPSTTSAEL